MINKAWKALEWALREGLDNTSINIEYSHLSAYDLYGCDISAFGLDCSQPMQDHLAILADNESLSERRLPILNADEILTKQETIILIYYI